MFDNPRLPLAIVSLALNGAAVAVFLRKFKALRVPRVPWGTYATSGAAAVAAVAALCSNSGSLGAIASGASLFVSIAYIVGTSYFARVPHRTLAALVGKPFLDFEALDGEGRPVRLSSLRGRPILLKFLRGHW